MGCAACGADIREAAKPRMLARGAWRATAPSADPSVAGFHINALYCPVGWLSWAGIAAKAEAAAGDAEQLLTVTHTVLGETYAAPTEAPDWHRLRDRLRVSVHRDRPDRSIVITKIGRS